MVVKHSDPTQVARALSVSQWPTARARKAFTRASMLSTSSRRPLSSKISAKETTTSFKRARPLVVARRRERRASSFTNVEAKTSCGESIGTGCPSCLFRSPLVSSSNGIDAPLSNTTMSWSCSQVTFGGEGAPHPRRLFGPVYSGSSMCSQYLAPKERRRSPPTHTSVVRESHEVRIAQSSYIVVVMVMGLPRSAHVDSVDAPRRTPTRAKRGVKAARLRL